MFTNRKRTDLLVNVGTFRNVTFYTTDPRGLLHKIVRVETYLPAGTFWGGRYIWRENYIMKNHINVPTSPKRTYR